VESSQPGDHPVETRTIAGMLEDTLSAGILNGAGGSLLLLPLLQGGSGRNVIYDSNSSPLTL
jgi:hypothetical protein